MVCLTRGNYSKWVYFVTFFWVVEALFPFAPQANEATGKHGTCMVEGAALAPPAGMVLVWLRFDAVTVCTITNKDVPPSRWMSFSARPGSQSAVHRVIFLFLLLLLICVLFGKAPGRKCLSLVFPVRPAARRSCSLTLTTDSLYLTTRGEKKHTANLR